MKGESVDAITSNNNGDEMTSLKWLENGLKD